MSVDVYGRLFGEGKTFSMPSIMYIDTVSNYNHTHTQMLNQLITHSSYLLVNLPCFRATIFSVLFAVAAVRHPMQSLLVVAAAVLGLLQKIVLSSLFLPLKRSTNTNCKFIFQTAYMRIVYYSSCNRFRSNICHLVSICIFFVLSVVFVSFRCFSSS